MKNPGLHHLQHILHRQGRIYPLNLHRGQFAQGQFLIDQIDRGSRRTAGGQRHGAARQLLKAGKAPLALDPHQQQGHIVDDRITGADGAAGLEIDQLTRGNYIAFTPGQCAQQLILGFRDDLEGYFLAIAGMAVEVAFKRTQTMVFNANRLPLHLARAVAALIDQHPQHLTAADLRQIADLTWLPDL